jgi:REP element-mobilizing transposase RayT
MLLFDCYSYRHHRNYHLWSKSYVYATVKYPNLFLYPLWNYPPKDDVILQLKWTRKLSQSMLSLFRIWGTKFARINAWTMFYRLKRELLRFLVENLIM